MPPRITRQQTAAKAAQAGGKPAPIKLSQTTITGDVLPSKSVVPKQTKKRKVSDVAVNEPVEEVPTKSKKAKASTQSQPGVKVSKKAKADAKTSKKARNESASGDDDEKRLRKFRPKATQSFLQKLHRAQTQRLALPYW